MAYDELYNPRLFRLLLIQRTDIAHNAIGIHIGHVFTRGPDHSGGPSVIDLPCSSDFMLFSMDEYSEHRIRCTVASYASL